MGFKKKIRFSERFQTSYFYGGSSDILVFYVYIIESLATKRWYVGFTSDLSDRLTYHNRGFNRSTKAEGPWRYVFQRSIESRNQAREFEKYLKAVRNKVFIRKKFAEYFIPAPA